MEAHDYQHWMRATAELSGKKMGLSRGESLHGISTLAVAEAIHRLAAAVEALADRAASR